MRRGRSPSHSKRKQEIRLTIRQDLIALSNAKKWNLQIYSYLYNFLLPIFFLSSTLEKTLTSNRHLWLWNIRYQLAVHNPPRIHLFLQIWFTAFIHEHIASDSSLGTSTRCILVDLDNEIRSFISRYKPTLISSKVPYVFNNEKKRGHPKPVISTVSILWSNRNDYGYVPIPASISCINDDGITQDLRIHFTKARGIRSSHFYAERSCNCTLPVLSNNHKLTTIYNEHRFPHRSSIQPRWADAKRHPPRMPFTVVENNIPIVARFLLSATSRFVLLFLHSRREITSSVVTTRYTTLNTELIFDGFCVHRKPICPLT